MTNDRHPAGGAAALLACAVLGVVLALAVLLAGCDSSSSSRPSAPGRPVLAPNGAPVAPVLIRVEAVELEDGDACELELREVCG